MDDQHVDMFSYLSPEQRVQRDHPLRAVRAMTDRNSVKAPKCNSMKCAFYREGPDL
jgi:hypothetical protein